MSVEARAVDRVRMCGLIDVCRVRLEALMDAWADAEGDASSALSRWRGAGVGDRERAYVAYVAAVDREQQAAALLAAALEARG